MKTTVSVERHNGIRVALRQGRHRIRLNRCDARELADAVHDLLDSLELAE